MSEITISTISVFALIVPILVSTYFMNAVVFFEDFCRFTKMCTNIKILF